MLKHLQEHITQDFSFLKGKKLLLAISGGIDSMVLLDLFSKLDFKIAIAHCNFQLRGSESDEDEEFVKIKSEKLKVKSFIKKFDTKIYSEQNKLSIQQAARELRYNWFEELMITKGYDYVLTAHHLEDSLETFLINFTRGTGIEGLTGIPEVNNKIIRPLLIFSRAAIENYAKENNMQWREDSSNASEKYFRNKIRHQIIPVLKELNPSLLQSYKNTITHLQQTNDLAKEAVSQQYSIIAQEKDNQITFDIPKLKSLNNYKAYLFEWLKSYQFSAWEDIYDLVDSNSGKQVFSNEYRLLKDREFLILTKKNEEQKNYFEINEEQTEIDFPKKLRFCNLDYIIQPSQSSIFVDKEKLKFPLVLRKWQEGDYFYPSGMNGKKKVSKYFKDEKFSLIDKENTWILCSQDAIIWIVNNRADQRFLATNNTKTILNITTI